MNAPIQLASLGHEPAPSLASFRDVHAGETILVCGCGDSINELTLPLGVVTIGVNDIGRRFHPDYLVVVNPRSQFSGDRFRYVEASQARYLFTQLDDLRTVHPRVVKFRLGRHGGADFSDPNVLHFTQNSPYVALCLATHMGARRIGLIGVDFTDHHFFARTGTHPLARQLATIDAQYRRLGEALQKRGIEVRNLSRASRLTAFPKTSLDAFLSASPLQTADKAEIDGLRIVSYATTPVAGVPAILARCISARTSHRARCVWATSRYGNGVEFAGDLEWDSRPDEAEAALREADVVVVHNGKVDEKHRRAIAGKAVVTMAHNYMWNVDQRFIKDGFPGVVVGQYQATLPEFAGWEAVPNPLPLWEPTFQPAAKGDSVTIAYTPSGKHESYPPTHRLYWHGKGYATTMRTLDRLAGRYPIQIEAVRDRQLTHAQALAAKQCAHIVIDECVTGSYHRNSLEGLALGCVVVNGVGILDGVMQVFRHCATESESLPFVHATRDSLEQVLATLIESGAPALADAGRRNREWVERHWDFTGQWTRFWKPIVQQAIAHAEARRRGVVAAPARPRGHRPSGACGAATREGVSVVVPHGGEERLPHLAASLANLQQCRGVSEIVVVEMGTAPGACATARRCGAKYVFVRSERAFERASSLNIGSGLAEFDLVLWKDNDLLIPAGFVEAAARELHARALDYLIPYASISYLSETDSAAVIAGGRDAASCRPVKTLLSRRHITGGAGLVRREFLARYGGLLEEFRGWGGEDGAWAHKAALLGRMGVSGDRDQRMLHLYHSGSGAHDGAPVKNNPHYAANLALLRQVVSIRQQDRFLERFPPPPCASCPWPGDKRIAFVTVAGDADADEHARLAADGLRQLYSIDIHTIAADPSADLPAELARVAPDAVVLFGAATALHADPEPEWLRARAVVVRRSAGPEPSGAAQFTARLLASNEMLDDEDSAVREFALPADDSAPLHVAIALAQPLSLALGSGNGSTMRNVAPRSARRVSDPSNDKPAASSTARALRNVYACLVHESSECVVDLVRNLRYLDGNSAILLYDGSAAGNLLDARLPWSRWGAEICPTRRPMQWGKLHEFALDCIRHLRGDAFDVVTIVDSDQLLLRAGYPEFLARQLPDRSGLGLLSSVPEPQGRDTRILPCATAHKELDLWRPFLRRFADGEAKFVHWTYWPSTVITADAAAALLDLFDTDAQLQRILAASKLWATEEVLFPTLAALLGFRIERNPCTYEYVRHRRQYGAADIDMALRRPTAFWMHPVRRSYEDPVRVRIRRFHGDYCRSGAGRRGEAKPHADQLWPILRTMRGIEGWLEDEEAELLAIAAREAILRRPGAKTIVEVGSHCGKSTFILASIARMCAADARVFAIDAFDGIVGARDRGLVRRGPTLERFKRMLHDNALAPWVETHIGRAPTLAWDRPVDLLLIDGLHDFASVAQDFSAFEAWLPAGALVAFHDYADYFPGVRAFVDELLAGDEWQEVAQAGSMKLLRRHEGSERAQSLGTVSATDACTAAAGAA